MDEIDRIKGEIEELHGNVLSVARQHSDCMRKLSDAIMAGAIAHADVIRMDVDRDDHEANRARRRLRFNISEQGRYQEKLNDLAAAIDMNTDMMNALQLRADEVLVDRE